MQYMPHGCVQIFAVLLADEELSEASSLAPEELQRQAVSAGRQPSASVGDRQQEENPAAPPASEVGRCACGQSCARV